jgi:gluconolactonase
MPQMREITSGPKFPEGPVAMNDGRVLVVETTGGTLTRVRPNGAKEVVAETGGGPNGIGLAPGDTRLYAAQTFERSSQ